MRRYLRTFGTFYDMQHCSRQTKVRQEKKKKQRWTTTPIITGPCNLKGVSDAGISDVGLLYNAVKKEQKGEEPLYRSMPSSTDPSKE